MPEIEIVHDPRWTLQEWKDFIDELVHEYGAQTVMFTDAGYNNVALILEGVDE